MKTMNEEIQSWIKQTSSYIASISYLFWWALFLWFLSQNGVPINQYPRELITSSIIILLVGVITKPTSWRIGHDTFGVSGDSRARIINYHGNGNGDFWYDLFADTSDLLKDADIRSLILKLAKKSEDHE